LAGAWTMIFAAMDIYSVMIAFAEEFDPDIIFGPLLFLGLVGGLGYFGYRRLRMRLSGSKWPMTAATIQSEFASNAVNAGVATVLHGGMAGAAARQYAWKAVLQYSYQVAGEFYSGYFLLGDIYSSSERASEAARPWVDRKIFVRYNPRNPDESVFRQADGAPQGSRSLGNQPPPSSDMITLSLK
jgi:hypothetical protein